MLPLVGRRHFGSRRDEGNATAVEHFNHIPVLLGEVLDALRPTSGGMYVDGTLGAGGHAEAILNQSLPSGRLAGCDRDEVAVEAASTRLAPFGSQAECRVGACSELLDWIPPCSVDGVLMDLGVSSPQLDRPERGFSFQQDGQLDMRMSHSQELTAATVVNEWGEEELIRIIRDLGGERQARRIVQAVIRARPLKSTLDLVRVIQSVKARRGRLHPATKVFQAIRMAVNDELGELKRALPVAASLLKPGGRLAVISFHSAEARSVKQFGQEQVRPYDVDGEIDRPEFRRSRVPRMRWVAKRAVKPGDTELMANPRARSAQLRVLEQC